MIPEDLRRFVLTSVPTVPHLEAVLLFHDQPELARSVEDVAHALYVPESAAGSIVAYLCEIGCIVRHGPGPGAAYRFMPRDAAMRAMLARLAAAYRADMIEMTHLIHDTTQKNAQRFADAFKLKKGH